jgi:EKC/KEOPS complex subunit CGI121/TPRKB
VQITSRLHLQTAIYQAILAAQSSLRTKTVHSEILWALNPTNNVLLFLPLLLSSTLTLKQITEAIRRYGVSDTTSALFVVRISGPDISTWEIQEKMNAVVSGTVVPIGVLETVTDWTSIKKV